MTRALRLAQHGINTTHPNPRVGCVIVKEGRIIGEAWHRRAGEPHAEILALKAAGSAARGATVYLNLEPCCHQGRTPPCTDSLIDAGVARVVAAMEDPNPQVAGGGVMTLRGAGIDVDLGLMAEQAERLNRGFVHRMRRGRPWVTLKLAATLDGRTGPAKGESKWITSDAARVDVHRLRARSSAVMTGIGTVLADDPQLTARMDGITRQPMRIVVDSNLTIPVNAKVLDAEPAALVVTATEDVERRRAIEAKGSEVLYLPGPHGAVDLHALMGELGLRDVNELLVESGPTLAGALLDAKLVNELVLYFAPSLLGNDGRGMFRLPHLQELADRVNLDIRDLRQVGPDLRITAAIH